MSLKIVEESITEIRNSLPPGVLLVAAAKTRSAFDRLSKAKIPNVEMRYLSMGMSNSYKIAIEEEANSIRVGTKLFGERYT